MASQASSPNQASLVNPPPSPAIPAEGRESEGHAIGFLMTTNQRRHLSQTGCPVPNGTATIPPHFWSRHAYDLDQRCPAE